MLLPRCVHPIHLLRFPPGSYDPPGPRCCGPCFRKIHWRPICASCFPCPLPRLYPELLSDHWIAVPPDNHLPSVLSMFPPAMFRPQPPKVLDGPQSRARGLDKKRLAGRRNLGRWKTKARSKKFSTRHVCPPKIHQALSRQTSKNIQP